jgi:hypothetical protein
MLNRTALIVAPTQHTTEYVTREVHEHRAPTDESVKLLREMEAKAQEQVIEAMHVGDMTFECVVHTLKRWEDDTTTLKAVFSLNGKKLTAEYTDHAWRTNKRDMVMKLRDEMAKVIAEQVLIPALSRIENC